MNLDESDPTMNISLLEVLCSEDLKGFLAKHGYDEFWRLVQ
jgi:hypothetical protein